MTCHHERTGGTPTSFLPGIVIVLTMLAGFGMLFAGVPDFWVAFPIGFGGVLPLSIAYAAHTTRKQGGQSTDHSRDDRDAALEAVRERYARGELTDAEFEAQVERLLETQPAGGDGRGQGGADRPEDGRRRDFRSA